ncbi:nitrate/nitrite sensor protein NarX [Yersinia pestis subsp. pestis]|nr:MULTISPECIES: hypothetical protein [Yersinia pseudotuberculosis complex]MCF2956929.1 nitrate/nitrite sensor protein NarX [Yersinia pestis subsp. pestis]EEO83751.1 hypothetical protein YPH_4391 [Yersinia pestis biovar Orientalis str. PEXU2]EEO90410.1 hypothetical protein YPS_2413 [Yersinia pestis Pestoides A]KYP01692.1 nitrate/nitrite sensor protein NarX [Yersinia pestis]KYP02284.1 nitrate/nitrite sensor protein NarX [Yersinia pestis]
MWQRVGIIGRFQAVSHDDDGRGYETPLALTLRR